HGRAPQRMAERNDSGHQIPMISWQPARPFMPLHLTTELLTARFPDPPHAETDPAPTPVRDAAAFDRDARRSIPGPGPAAPSGCARPAGPRDQSEPGRT